MTLQQYKNEKIRMLMEDFEMDLLEAEIDHIQSLKTEIQIDNYVRTLFDKYL